MRVLMIGGTGFIGLPAGVQELIGDRRRLAEFAGKFRRVNPDIAIDVICASQQQAQLSLEPVPITEDSPLREIDAKQFDYAAENRILQKVA
jgi:hypothetical protein